MRPVEARWRTMCSLLPRMAAASRMEKSTGAPLRAAGAPGKDCRADRRPAAERQPALPSGNSIAEGGIFDRCAERSEKDQRSTIKARQGTSYTTKPEVVAPEPRPAPEPVRDARALRAVEPAAA